MSASKGSPGYAARLARQRAAHVPRTGRPGPRAYGRAPRAGERVNCGSCVSTAPDDYSCEDCKGLGYLDYGQAMAHIRFKQQLAARGDSE